MSLFATDIDEELLTEKIQLEAAIGKINSRIAKEVSKYVSNDKFPQFKISIRESEDDEFEHEGYYDNAKDAVKALMGYI
jgi:hypothetical protein